MLFLQANDFKGSHCHGIAETLHACTCDKTFFGSFAYLRRFNIIFVISNNFF